ncbi:MAG TPA: S8 family serine peptidase [Actinomycetota bacterium]|nr:S8 family serine peptidase [Actinomycetota bacterium]
MGARKSLAKRGAVLLAGVLVAALPASSSQAQEERQRYIVVLERGVPAHAAAHDHSRSENAEVGFVYEHALNGYSATMSPQAAERIQNDPRVEYVEPDIELHATAQTLPTGVNRIDAELSPTARINSVDERVDVDIAILDSGIDLDHPDLNVVANTGCAGGGPTNNVCTNGAGDDNNGHGTHVAGIAAAIDNGFGVVGVAPGARLHAVKVLDSRGSGYLSWIIAGVDWVTARSATIEVANMSLGGQGWSSAYRTAIANSVNRGIVYYVAAGNERRDIYGTDNTFGTSDDTIPASFPEVGTISALADFDGRPGGLGSGSYSYAVGCTENRDDSFACFSNFAKNNANSPVTSSGGKIDMMLPGTAIVSTYYGGRYASTHGTSQASPHAAGLAGLYIARNGRATSASGVYAIRQALINAGYGQTTTNGLTTHDDPDLRKEPIGWGATL